MIDFENIEEKLKQTCKSRRMETVSSNFRDSKKIYIIGNGGLHFTAAHAATDCSKINPR